MVNCIFYQSSGFVDIKLAPDAETMSFNGSDTNIQYSCHFLIVQPLAILYRTWFSRGVSSFELPSSRRSFCAISAL